jgi:ATP adenylyltransferase
MMDEAPVDLPPCRFCPAKIRPLVVAELDSVWAVRDRHPVSEGHHLIIPKRHAPDWFSMTERERRDAEALLLILKSRISADRTVTGFNIGMNCGESAGQTVFHAHIHLIPRRDGDTPHPLGGVRGVIPDKMRYPASPAPCVL